MLPQSTAAHVAAFIQNFAYLLFGLIGIPEEVGSGNFPASLKFIFCLT